ncbi:hypothetical protein Gbro_4216 [Gordonia bronchialis DSM 43247]|jgi:hypothetical protein|uniref:Integral membrane protein n=1 Tax=Gordonia bronchialis (strain ATCC 25592 / DSM 43247 / BCRC 13721 / JCM 3198 / KCTC 3076 / NBRC 16047 / NCTC 10667) TaxID=526226 RepID=D0L5B0_GORB4|nr:DUF4235 domain-containing protein [Gordonia bronchialis]ACY23368.1 hypothetical protein Gbro_4216 [Gordonia bronchialis DSM 43247]MCC3321536.1 DUF4235 domain-containing protein [Gordonia bronchialis]QGS23251.1 DUF4235 domain-containing protein [Gordonia bronchialis]UAK36383.1 DUF4235 domain-containing protein [Gordonia bronchialis]STQ66355.1 Uncharacterised protein [Gordonia bronchialis]
MSTTSKVLYKPLSMATGVLGGIAASAAFGQIWKRVANDPSTPDPKDLRRSNTEVLAAAALQGLIFGLVRAAVDRAGARGYKAVTNEDPT